ncbi:hypothetical protein ACWC9U_22420 [Streptomyces sp. 900116325]
MTAAIKDTSYARGSARKAAPPVPGAGVAPGRMPVAPVERDPAHTRI